MLGFKLFFAVLRSLSNKLARMALIKLSQIIADLHVTCTFDGKVVFSVQPDGTLMSGSATSAYFSLPLIIPGLAQANMLIERPEAAGDAGEDSSELGDVASKSYQAYHSAYLPRAEPRTLPLLRPGMEYKGTQRAGEASHRVLVTVKHVDMRESYICGFLKILKLTSQIHSLTTFFEGELIGPRYPFATEHPEWGATPASDLAHWSIFPQIKRLEDLSSNLYVKENYDLQRYVFMRWKEKFVVPVEQDQGLDGASYSGFYYLCLDQLYGHIYGYYYQKGQKAAEQYQRLDLRADPVHGANTFEFC